MAAARTAVEQLTGSPAQRVELIVRYAGRLVCVVTLPDRRLVFKAGPEDSVRLEAWVSETLRRLGVGAPAVVATDVSRGRFPLAYLLMEEIPGVPLPGWPSDRELSDPDFDRPDFRAVLHEAGRQLGLVHSVRMSGFGLLDPSPLAKGRTPAGRWTSWAAYVADDAHANLESLSRQRVLPAAVRAALDPCIERLELDEGRLLHGDFIARHLFVTPGQTALTGILDFGALSGDPAFDIAVADVDHRQLEPSPGPFAWLLLEGYGPDPALLDALAGRLLLYRAVRALGEAAFMHANGEDVQAQLRMLRWSLDYLARAPS